MQAPQGLPQAPLVSSPLNAGAESASFSAIAPLPRTRPDRHTQVLIKCMLRDWVAAERNHYNCRADWPQPFPLIDEEDEVGRGSPVGCWREEQERKWGVEGEVGPRPGCCLPCVGRAPP